MLKKKKPNKEVSYEQIGKMVESIYLSGYIDRNQLYKMSFIKGLFTGVGGVVGATIVAGIIIWLISLFNYTPLKPIFEPFSDSLKSQNK